MYFFRKKHFALILCFLGLSLFSFAVSENVTKRSYEIQQVSALPVNEKIIIIDAGHGGEDGGAVKIALKLQNLLEQSGATVILTRSDDNAIYELDSKTLSQKKISDIKNRVKLSKEASANIFVSIHMNKISETQYDGFQTFYNSKSENR